jgi:hypothetical protein
MKPLLIRRLSARTRLIVSAVLLVAVMACDDDDPNNPSNCDIITGTTTTSYSAAGGSSSISVSANPQCAWTATSNASFLTVTQGASGTGDGVVQFAVAANTGPARTATLTITGTAITITQSAP